MNDNLVTIENEGVETENRYLLFHIDETVHGVPLTFVKEIIQVRKIIALPGVDEHVLGIMNLRGKVLPVVDMRQKLGLRSKEMEEVICVIVAQIEETQIGLAVDSVSEVLRLDSTTSALPPGYGEVALAHVSSITEIGDRTILNIDMQKLFADDLGALLFA